MTRTMVKHQSGYLPFPEPEDWSIRQLNIKFTLQNIPSKHSIPLRHIDYISYHYGDLHEIIEFANFFSSYWGCGGRVLNNDAKDFYIIDTKFIEWVKLMQFEEYCDAISLSFDFSYKRFMYVANPED